MNYRFADALLSTAAMRAVFDGTAWLQRMLDAEAALALAEEQAGVIPAGYGATIAAACRAENFNPAAVAEQGAVAGTPVIPLVRMLAERVGGPAANYVHFGATSQDVIDTGLMLQIGDALDLLVDQLLRLGADCADLAVTHRTTPTVARTLAQHAVPMPFGLKAAQWLAAVSHHIERLRSLRRSDLVAQLGGAGGTLAALSGRGDQVARLFAERLALAAPPLPWHTRRDGIAEIVCALGVVSGAIAKIATDLVLLSQTEVGEISATAGGEKGTSSAMPHKLNPIDAVLARAAAERSIALVPLVLSAMAQEHERAAGGWQAEWTAVPDAFGATAAAIGRAGDAVAALRVDAGRMARVAQISEGRIMSEVISAALVPHLGRAAAQRTVAEADREAVSSGRPFLDVIAHRLAAIVGLDQDAIDALLDPVGAWGSSSLFIDRAVAQFHVVSAT